MGSGAGEQGGRGEHQYIELPGNSAGRYEPTYNEVMKLDRHKREGRLKDWYQGFGRVFVDTQRSDGKWTVLRSKRDVQAFLAGLGSAAGPGRERSGNGAESSGSVGSGIGPGSGRGSSSPGN